MMKWHMQEHNFYTDIPEISEPYNEDLHNEELLCSCYGRGKSMKDVDFPRLPHFNILNQKQKEFEKLCSLGGQGALNNKSRGRGRARLLKQYADKSSLIGQKSPNFTNLQAQYQQLTQSADPAIASESSLVNDMASSIHSDLYLSEELSQIESDNQSVRSSGGFGTPPVKYQDFRNDFYEVYNGDFSGEYRQPQRKECTLESFLAISRVKQSKNKKKKKSQKNQSSKIGSCDENVTDFHEKEENKSLNICSEVYHEATITNPQNFSLSYEESQTNVIEWLNNKSDISIPSHVDKRSGISKLDHFDIPISQKSKNKVNAKIVQRDDSNLYNIRPMSPECNTGTNYPDLNHHSTHTSVKSDNRIYHGKQSDFESLIVDSDKQEWSLTEGNIIQIEGLPLNCDLSILHDIIISCGTVIESEILKRGNNSMGRFKLDTADACDWLVSCLHDSDCLYPDSNSTLVCCKVDTM